MPRIDALFAKLRAEGRKALVAYLPVGDPDVETSLELAKVALDAGADILELGVPFSDPTADGPAIARASERAIAAGSSLRRTLDAAARLRATTDAPLVVFGYYNPIFVLGERRTVLEAKKAGVDALLVVDLPPEEGAELRDEAERQGVAIIPLLTPTSGADRVKAATARASGFVYYVSVTGVTGAASESPLRAAAKRASQLREASGLPVVVGFGIDGPAKARLAAGLDEGEGPDGVVVGTAIVRAIEQAGERAQRERAVAEVVGSIRAALG